MRALLLVCMGIGSRCRGNGREYLRRFVETLIECLPGAVIKTKGGQTKHQHKN